LSAALNGGDLGDILRGAAIGGIQGAIAGGILQGMGQAASLTATGVDDVAHVMGHGIFGGSANVAMGGKFQDGFLAGAAGASANYIKFASGDVVSKTVKASVVGGTASVIGGGKFANGAYTAAFQYLLNAEVGGWSDAASVGKTITSIIQLPFRIVGFLNFLGNFADYMRSNMIVQSSRDSRNIGHPSVGHRSGGFFRKLFGMSYGGDGIKIGGGRISPYSNEPSPLGGIQGQQGEIFGQSYAPFSLSDFVVEAFAGPHDYLNSPFWYDPSTGNIRGGISPLGKFAGGVMNWANVPISSLFVIPSIILPTANTFP